LGFDSVDTQNRAKPGIHASIALNDIHRVPTFFGYFEGRFLRWRGIVFGMLGQLIFKACDDFLSVLLLALGLLGIEA
jgi:hypothetical protein